MAPRFALVGDAAHGVHPIAGQGLNLALRDVAALTEVVADAVRLGLDAGDAQALDRYERWRRFDSALSAATFDGLNRLFSNDSTLLRSAREVGLGVVDRMPALKRFFVGEAAGLTGDVPRLLRGEAGLAGLAAHLGSPSSSSAADAGMTTTTRPAATSTTGTNASVNGMSSVTLCPSRRTSSRSPAP